MVSFYNASISIVGNTGTGNREHRNREQGTGNTGTGNREHRNREQGTGEEIITNY
jgi:hypothetical protein